jgi:hypothetical protein
MRKRAVIQIVSFAVITVTGVLGVKSRATASDLRMRLAALTVQRNAAEALVQQRDHLRSELTEATLTREANVIAASRAALIASCLPLGEWRSSREWRNEGQATARATIATLLWAAAGGDMPTMESTLTFEDEGWKHAQAAFEALPPASRQLFPTPAALVAGAMIVAVPNQAAKLSWVKQNDADHATASLLLGSEPTAKAIVLSLQRSSLGWRILVPADAIERLGRK